MKETDINYVIQRSDGQFYWSGHFPFHGFTTSLIQATLFKHSAQAELLAKRIKSKDSQDFKVVEAKVTIEIE